MVSVSSFSEAGGHRVNEDAFAVQQHPLEPGLWLCFVADGQGGRAGGGPAAQRACRSALAAAACSRLAVVKLDTKLLDACVGRYEFPPDGGSFGGMKMAVRREGEELLCQAWGEGVLQGAIDLLPQSETTFILKIDGARLTFRRNDKGEVTAVTHRLAGYPDLEGVKRKD